MSRIPQINIGLFGLGTVGSSVYKIIEQNSELISNKLGFPVHIKKICEPDSKKAKALHVQPSKLTAKTSEVLDDPEISIIVELIGDKPIALEVMKSALELGKHVVTANKAILAKFGPELYEIAASSEVDILFEASVAGAIPVLRSIREGFIADNIQSVHGIINGTANYILTAMSEKNQSFADALAQAQQSGFAEADPTSDIEGIDTAHKLTILTALAYGKIIEFDKIYREGITKITAFDIQMAKQFEYAIKLFAISKYDGNEIQARVHPAMIKAEHPLANVNGVFNAVMLKGELSGESILYGHGAGGFPTATAVVADVIEIARNIANQVPGVPPLGYKIDKMRRGKIKPMDEINCKYYLRINAIDKPGVFAKIANCLGEHHVSISSVHQKASNEGDKVPIVVLTHQAKEKSLMASVKEIDALPFISEKTLIIRIES